MDDVPVVVAEHLDLDVARRLHVLLEVDVTHAEGRLGLAHGGLERPRQFLGRPDDPHPASAAAGHGLDDDRIAQLPGDLDGLVLPAHRPVTAGQNRNTGLLHGPAGPRLVPHQPDHVRIRTDELDVAGLADLRQVGALRQEAVAGVDGVGTGDLGGADDGRNVQIAVEASGRADADVLVGEPDVQRVLVGLGVDGHGLDAQLAARADHAQGDLSAVGDQHFVEHVVSR